MRQWSTLLQAGISLVPALQMLQRSTSQPTLRGVLMQVCNDVQAGQALHRAMQAHPDIFTPLHISLVQAGESAGILDTMMERLSQTLDRNLALQSRLRAALIYPSTVIGIAVVVVVLMLVYIVPVFEEVFQSLGAALPWSTRMVLSLSRALNLGGLWALLPVCGAALWLKRRGQDKAWLRQWHRRLLGWPGLGVLMQMSLTARWAQTLSALLAAGVPLTDALPVAGRATAHPIYERLSEHLQRRIAQGGLLSEGMAHSGRFPDLLVQLCATGEASGTLETLLDKAAVLLGEAFDARVQALTTVLEPLIVVLLGGAIGVILVAMYLPIFRLGQAF